MVLVYNNLILDIKFELLKYLNINELANLSENISFMKSYLNNKINSFQKLSIEQFLNLYKICENCDIIDFYDYSNKKTINNNINFIDILQNTSILRTYNKIYYSNIHNNHNVIFEKKFDNNEEESIGHNFGIWQNDINENRIKINMYYFIENNKCIIIYIH